MAEKKITKTEDRQIKPITLKDDNNGDIFVLEFDRATVKFAESRGFKISVFEDNVINLSAIEEIFFYAFRKHQPRMSKADTDRILYDKLGGMPEGMLERLTDLYLVPFTTLMNTEDKAKNGSMTVEF